MMAHGTRKLNSKDLVLLLLYVPGWRGQSAEPTSGRTRITKMVFLFEKEVWPKFGFDERMGREDLPPFEPFHFGPFSSAVYTDLDFLTNLGMVTASTSPESTSESDVIEEEALEYRWWLREAGLDEERGTLYRPEVFSLTPLGQAFVDERLLPHLTEDQLSALSELKAQCTKVPLDSLLRYVYTKYEKYAAKSQIRDEILRDRARESRGFST